jgi:hypothetical protein
MLTILLQKYLAYPAFAQAASLLTNAEDDLLSWDFAGRPLDHEGV